jgi:phospholipase A2
MLEEKNDDLVKVHPIDPATIPNWAYGMKEKLPSSCPDSVFKNDHLQLMDAGMSNNLPIYPLLRQDRNVDIVIAFDASADIKKENWLSVVDGYATQRGIKTWPVGTGWPKKSAKPAENVQALEEAQATSTAEATARIEGAKDQTKKEDDKSQSKNEGSICDPNSDELSACNIWVGSKEEKYSKDEPPSSKRLAWDDPEDSTFHLMRPDASITVIYFPLLPNPKVPNVDPDKTDFMSTWNFIYTPEQVDKVVELARTNFQEGADATKRTIRVVYERKKSIREGSENKGRIKRLAKTLREHGDTFAT